MDNLRSNILFRYILMIVVVIIVCVFIIGKAAKTSFVEGDMWKKKVDSLKREDITILPNRGNILACDGRLMASSIPQYYIYLDFKADGLKKDTLMKYIGPLSEALSKKLKDRSPAGYKQHILIGYKSKKRGYQLYKGKISYTDLKEIKTFPFLKLRSNQSGFVTRKLVQRKKPFGSLASRTIGDIYGEYDKGGKNGLELQYDSILKGLPGKSTRQKIRGRFMNVTDVEPVDGMDIISTIDIGMQDITQTALYDKLKEIDAESGTAVLMEVKTGEIKAITNLGQMGPGIYGETQNHAVADEIEPGSTFKVASMMAALDLGVVKPNDTIDTGDGVWQYAGRKMTDHNWTKTDPGFKRIAANQVIWYSSNIGVAKIILKNFEKRPSVFVNKLYEMKLNEQMNLEIPGAGRPKIKSPHTNGSNWSKTSLPWMSFGYETQIPPIYTLAFFNAIANEGKMIKPIFVKQICKSGEVYETRVTEVINEAICKKQTLAQIKEMLLGVVEKGTGKPVKSENMLIAGKTGTAQIAQGKSGYSGAGVKHLVTFCGYFPADQPKYSCIVVIRNPRIGYPSGGTMSGVVFKNIAERVYAQSLRLKPDKIYADSLFSIHPMVSNGNYKQTSTVLDKLNIKYDDNRDKSKWIKANNSNDNIVLEDYVFKQNLVPSVYGMKAKDAVYLLENSGLKVRLSGRGSVNSQSIQAGTRIIKGQPIVLILK